MSQMHSGEADFTLDDFREQLIKMSRIGGMKELIGQMPDVDGLLPEGEDPDAAIRRVQGIIDGMTRQERRTPDVIDVSRRRRIALGSGVEPHDIDQFLAQFDQVRTLMRQMASMSMWQRLRRFWGYGMDGPERGPN